MLSHIKTAHEEQYSDGSRTLGILVNYSSDYNQDGWKESFAYIYRDGMYIFFNTMVDMFDYLLYGEDKMKRAYLEEEEFDKYYDTEFIEGKFIDLLTWI